MAGKKEDGTGRAGRRSGLTLGRMKNIITVLTAGNFIGTACEFAGIGTSTYDDWRRRGETELDRVAALPRVNVDTIMDAFEGAKGTPEYMWEHRPAKFLVNEWPYVVFQHQVMKARASAEVRALHQINSAMGESWQAAAWFLERTKPERYGRQQRLNLEGAQPGSPVKIITVDALEERMREVLGD